MQVSGQRPGRKERSAEPLALPIRARFVPLPGRPDCTVLLVYALASRRPVLRRSSPTGRRAGLVRACGRGQAAGSARVIPSRRRGGVDRVRAARRRIEDWPGRCRGERHCARVWTLHERRHHVARVPAVSSPGLDLVEPVIYLSWTDDVPIVYPPYTCATGNVQDECLTLMGVHVRGPSSHLTVHDPDLPDHRVGARGRRRAMTDAVAADRGITRPARRLPARTAGCRSRCGQAASRGY